VEAVAVHSARVRACSPNCKPGGAFVFNVQPPVNDLSPELFDPPSLALNNGRRLLMRVPVLPVPSATLAQSPGILTLIHGRANNTVVFVFACAIILLWQLPVGQFGITTVGCCARFFPAVHRQLCMQADNTIQYGGMCGRWRALGDGVAMCSNGNGTWDQRSATNTETSACAERNLMFANSAKMTVIRP
jgi:hypothetical protein